RRAGHAVRDPPSAAGPSTLARSAGAPLGGDVAVRCWLRRGLARVHAAALPGARRRITWRRQADRLRRLRDRDGRRADGPVGAGRARAWGRDATRPPGAAVHGPDRRRAPARLRRLPVLL